MKRNYLLVLVVISVCLFTSCNNDDANSNQMSIEELRQEVQLLNSMIREQEKNIENLNQELTALKTDTMNSYQELYSWIYRLDHLLQLLPEKRLGKVTNIKNDSIIIDIVQMVKDPEMPNGFILENDTTEHIELVIDENISVFVLNGDSVDEINLEEFKESNPEGFYHFILLDNKLVQIVEIYLP